MREGVRLVVALANFEFDLDNGSFRYTVCFINRVNVIFEEKDERKKGPIKGGTELVSKAVANFD